MPDAVMVTTFHTEGYKVYGERCLQTFVQYWPNNYELWAYCEGFNLNSPTSQVKAFDLISASPELVAFKQRWANEKAVCGYLRGDGYDYNYDAVRFCHKIFALLAAVSQCQARYIVWLDADIVTLKEIPNDFIQKLLPNDNFVAYLGRMAHHSETGFIVYDLQHQFAQEFFATMRNMYLSGEFLNLLQWTDSFVFDNIRATMAAQGKIACNNLSKDFNSMHPFVNCILGEYMDHLKGPTRKQQGKSFDDDYMDPKTVEEKQ